MSPEQRRIETAIAALTAQRALLGDAVVELAIAPLRAKLAAAQPLSLQAAGQTLRQVSILFLDMVGSTALSQHLDPEDIHVLLDGVLDRCTTLVGTQGGKVLQYAGDSLLAVFGSEVAREDDAERAVRAGLMLLDQGRRQRESVTRAHGRDDFALRIGIHTGNVLLGGVDSEGTIRGLAVAIAARMEQTAPAGTLRISRDTYRQVRGLFDVEVQAPIAVHGLDEPVASYLVQRARPRSFGIPGRGAEDGPTGAASAEMIGRQAEIDDIVGLVEEARATRSLRMLTVVAEAGLGKSRLLVEVGRRLEGLASGVRVLHGRSQRHGVNVSYGLVRDMLAGHCGILDNDEPANASGKLMAAFGTPFGERGDEQAALVGQLIGLDFSSDPHIAGIVLDGRQIRSRAFHAIAQFLRMRCATGVPVVLLVDDLHWADDGSLDLIEHLETACRDVPLVLGCFARPGLTERRPRWGETTPGSRRIVLDALDEACSAKLADTLLARLSGPAPRLRAVLLENAEGNPFHMEELLGMLIDDGAIVVDGDAWRVDEGRLVATRVPPTLTAVLQARLDALPSREKLALQRGSVIGHVFWDGALSAIAPEAVAAIEPLADRALIQRRETSAFAGVEEYAFKHHLLHQVTYDTVLGTARRTLHRRTAEWLVVNAAGRIGGHLGLIAEHYQRAGDAIEAVEYLRRAAKAAFGAAAFSAALEYIDRALALVPDSDAATRFDLVCDRFGVHNATGRRVEQADDTHVAERLAGVLGDDRHVAKASRLRSLLALVTGDYGVALEAAARAHAMAMAIGDKVTALEALLDKGQAHIFTGDPVATTVCLDRALVLAREAARPDLECVALNRLHTLAMDAGDLLGARALGQQAMAVAVASNNRRYEGALMGNLANLETRLGNGDVARRLLVDGLAISRAIGDRGSEPYTLHGMAMAALQQEDFGTALALATEAEAIAREVVDRGSEAECRRLAAACHVALGNERDAIDAIDAFEAWAVGAGRPVVAQSTIALRAELELSCGRIDAAHAIATRLAAWLDTRGDVEDGDDLERYFVCHRVFAAGGAARADEFLERATALLASRVRLLPEPECRTFVDNIPLHREIVAAGLARSGR